VNEPEPDDGGATAQPTGMSESDSGHGVTGGPVGEAMVGEATASAARTIVVAATRAPLAIALGPDSSPAGGGSFSWEGLRRRTSGRRPGRTGWG
jgi:hypothetical protein